MLTGTGQGAQLGILIKGPQVLEDTRTVDPIVLDKTGTVTTGQLSVAGIHCFTNARREELLALAGTLEAGSEHPIARAITRSATGDGPLLPVTDFESAPGGGVRGIVSGRRVVAGRAGWLEDNGIITEDHHHAALQTQEGTGATVIRVGVAGPRASSASPTRSSRGPQPP